MAVEFNNSLKHSKNKETWDTVNKFIIVISDKGR